MGVGKDSFKGTKVIRLQPGTTKAPYQFTFEVNSSLTANDGAIPYGTTITSAAVKAFDEAGTDATAELINSTTNTDTVVKVLLKYPTDAGRYSLEIVLTLTDTSTEEFDFTRIYAEDVAA